MKTRIKMVVNGYNVVQYYPQVRDFLFWSNLLDRFGNIVVWSNLKFAQNTIDTYIQERKDEALRNKKVVTIIKYP